MYAHANADLLYTMYCSKCTGHFPSNAVYSSLLEPKQLQVQVCNYSSKACQTAASRTKRGTYFYTPSRIGAVETLALWRPRCSFKIRTSTQLVTLARKIGMLPTSSGYSARTPHYQILIYIEITLEMMHAKFAVAVQISRSCEGPHVAIQLTHTAFQKPAKHAQSKARSRATLKARDL